MAQARKGDTVKVHYTGKLDDGKVFDTSASREPIEFTIGDGQVIPGFEHAVEGMNPGDTKEIKIQADNAYGPRQDDMVVEVSRDLLPDNLEPEVGQQLQVRLANGQMMLVRISKIANDKVTLDANHPLAGETLNFDIKLVEITA